jgi:hypothetical protein
VTVKSKQRVTLTGSATHPKDLPLEFLWLQAAGPPVQLEGYASATLSFEAPEVTAQPVVLSFDLRADDGTLLSPASRVDVTVVPADAVGFGAGGEGCSTSSRALARSAASSITSTLAPTALTLGLLVVGALLRRRARRP